MMPIISSVESVAPKGPSRASVQVRRVLEHVLMRLLFVLVVVTRIDRLARSIADLSGIVAEVKEKGVTLRAIEQPIDTGSAAGRAFLQMLGVSAEFETNIRKERQMEGIRAAQAKGVYKGRPPSIEPAAVAALQAEGLGPTEIAAKLKISRASVYRALSPAPSPTA